MKRSSPLCVESCYAPSVFSGARRDSRNASSCVTVRYWRERLLGLAFALVALSVYGATLCPCVFPGNSALAFVSVLHTELGREMVGHPLWNLSARLFSVFPVGEIPFRLNLFSALCGAGAVFFLFRLVTLILYDVLSEEHWVPQIDGESRSEVLPKDGLRAVEDAVDTINEKGHRMALAGGAVSSLAFVFCAPFWQASTALHFQTFELLLILSVGYALARYLTASSISHLLIAVFLMGAGAVESVFLFVLLPLSFLLFFFSSQRRGHVSALFIGLLISCFAGGVLLAGVAQLFWVTQGGVSFRVLMKIASMWFLGHLEGLRAMMTHKGWLLMLAEGLLPLLIVYAGRYHFAYAHLLSPSTEDSQEYEDRDPEEHRARVSKLFWGMALSVLLVCVAHALLNLSGSPWYFSRESAYLPVLPLLGVSMTLGFLSSYALVIGSRIFIRHSKQDAGLSGAPSRVTGVASAGVIVTVCALIGVSVFQNSGEIEGQKARFVDQFCREILNAAPDVRCLVTDGTFDMNLSVQARLLKREVTLLNIRDPRNWSSSSVTGAAGVKRQTAEAFLVEWLASHPDACSQVAVITAPRFWIVAGFQAVPNTLVYRGAKPDVKLDYKLLVQSHCAFWEKKKLLLVGDAPCSLLLRKLQAEIREHVSRVANDLGVLCLCQDARKEARASFMLALDMDPRNLCAQVNQCPSDPASAGTNQANSVAWVAQINKSITRASSFASLAEWERHYGALYLPAVEQLANLCNKVPDHQETEDKRPPALRLARDYVLASIRATAEPRASKQMSLKDAMIDDEVMTVVKAITGGYSKAAENQLRNLLRKRRASLVAWALLAEALMNQRNFSEVRNTVLPEMRFIAGDKGSEWIDLTEGCLALRQDKPDYRVAHDHFMGVLKCNPNIEEAQELLVQSSLSLGDEALIESDCNAVMKISPRQPMANAALGALRLSQGRLEEAEKALNFSIASRPSAPSLNDLGETLRRMQRFQVAEGATRRALLLNPGFYQAWDTLALILRDQKRLEEASEAHRSALRLCQSDIRLYLSAAQLEQQRGDLGAVRRLLQEAAPLLARSAPVYQERYNELMKNLLQSQKGR